MTAHSVSLEKLLAILLADVDLVVLEVAVLGKVLADSVPVSAVLTNSYDRLRLAPEYVFSFLHNVLCFDQIQIHRYDDGESRLSLDHIHTQRGQSREQHQPKTRRKQVLNAFSCSLSLSFRVRRTAGALMHLLYCRVRSFLMASWS